MAITEEDVFAAANTLDAEGTPPHPEGSARSARRRVIHDHCRSHAALASAPSHAHTHPRPDPGLALEFHVGAAATGLGCSRVRNGRASA